MNTRHTLYILVLIFFMGIGFNGWTTPPVSLTPFASIPVLDDGRKVPMDTYARNRLLQFSGRSSYKDLSALEWLAQLVFEPEQSATHTIFLINHPEVAQALRIPVDDKRRYSAAALLASWSTLSEWADKASRIAGEDQSLVEKEMIRVFVNLRTYLDLSYAFRFAWPHENFTIHERDIKQHLRLPEDRRQFSFLEIFLKSNLFHPIVEPLRDKSPEEWTAFEREIFKLSSHLYSWSQDHLSGLPVLLPIEPHGEEVWMSAWDAFALGLRDQAVLNALRNMQGMARAYRERDQAEFDRSIDGLRLFVGQRMSGDRELKHIGLEVTYNALNLFYRAEIFYFLAFLSAFAVLLTTKRKQWFALAAVILVGVAFIPHTAGIIMRMIIMERPPVTNLYSTFLFVAWVCVGVGLLVEYIQRNGLGTLTAGFTGFALLLLSACFAAEGDTMHKVVAVLNSNFWLSTHVIAITIGYAGCCLAGFVGHIYLLQAIMTPRQRQRLEATYRVLFGLLGFGLTFSFLGTMLGGVWADQSWGRFWGWDPKENGALLIVLWCAILFHAKLGKIIGEVGVAAGSALGIIMVMMAWLGVNLLGVGLHSYGFTSGLARGLYTYSAVQALIIFVLGPVAKYRTSQSAVGDGVPNK